MDFNLSEEQRMLLESADRLMKVRGTVENWRRRRSLPDGCDPAGWTQFAELGWLALPIPEEAGGIGGSMEDVALLMVSLGRGLSTEPYVSSAVIGAHVIDRTGCADRVDLLGAIAAGSLRVALAHQETGERTGALGPRRTIARPSGNGLVLSGHKTLVHDAPSADRLIVSCRLEDSGQTALLLVDAHRPGVTRTSYPLVDGSMASDIDFADVELAGDALLIAGPPADEMLSQALDRATLALIAQSVGSMEACLDTCSAYLKERRQFGVPLGSFQSLQHILVDMLIATHQSRSILYQALANIDAEPAQRRQAVSGAKVVAGEAMQLVSRSAIQLHGGYGLTDEYAASHHFRRLHVLEKAYGDIDHHQRRLAQA